MIGDGPTDGTRVTASSWSRSMQRVRFRRDCCAWGILFAQYPFAPCDESFTLDEFLTSVLYLELVRIDFISKSAVVGIVRCIAL